MATIGNLGSLITFSTSDKKILTFTNFSQRVKGRWSTHNIIGGKPKSEFNGPDLRSVSFKISLSAMNGVKPLTVLKNIEDAVEKGTPLPLVIGGKKIGSYQWVITEMSETWDCIYSKGELVTAEASLSIQEYV